VLLQVGPEQYWVSIADSDIPLWMRGLAEGRGLAATVEETDIFPLAVQGPKAPALMARVFGEAVHDIRFFRYEWFEFNGRPLVVARSGYSKQDGFEIYVKGEDLCLPLWDRLMEAGQDLEVRAGGPNLIERIEGGLLSYGNDMTRANTPYECGAGAACKLDTDPPCLAARALQAEAEHGPKRQIRGLRIDGPPVPNCRSPWPMAAGGAYGGIVTSAVWSTVAGTNVAIGMVERDFTASGTRLTVEAPDGVRDVTVCDLPHVR